MICENCGFIWYKNPIPAAGAIILSKKKLLLVKRKYPPQEGLWCLPAGFMETDETPEECCIREVKEETGLDISIVNTFRNYPGHDDPRAKVVLLIYMADIVGGTATPGDDAIELEFFSLDNIPKEIAFRAHVEAISDLKIYLRGPDKCRSI
jgi:ADP-ribose pyrophosphatase YjhB (NUDIX family)